MPTEDGLLTAKEAAILAKKTTATISAWVKQGILPVTNISTTYKKVYRFRPEDVLSCADSMMNDGRREMTEEELDAMIAEQMQCLPPDWDLETRKMQGLRPKDLIKKDAE